MKKSVIAATLFSSILPVSSVLADNSISTNLGITSNYIWRGVTQSDDGISVSAGADYANDSGFYAGTWTASVDFNDDTNFEYDLYAGYQTDIGGVNIDLGYLYYGYQGGEDLDFSELYVRTSFNNLTLALSTLVDNDTDGDFGDTKYYEASYSFPLAHDISLDFHAGHYNLPNDNDYNDFNLAVSKSGFTLMYSRVSGNDDLDDNLIALSYSKSFEF